MPQGPPDARGLTRRSLLLGTAGALVAPQPAAAAQRSRVRTRWAGVLTALPRTFQVPDGSVTVGVEWAAPASPRLHLRARLRSGWGPWVPAGSAAHGPGRFGEPLWLGDAREIELRAEGTVLGARLHFVTAARSNLAAAAALPLAQPQLDTGGGQPDILARQAWAGNGYPPRFGPSLGTVRLGFVHHTENPNGYSPADVPSLLRSIYTYHHDVRGWSDIGYNFVIDLYGRAWEARYGGIDLAVVGAQAGGYNEFSTGIAVLGSFGGSPPSRAAMRMLERLLAWKLSLHGVPVLGRVQVQVDQPLAAGETRYAPGSRPSLQRVSGHRDGDYTDCPGDALYTRLPSVRQAAGTRAGSARAVLTLSGPASVSAGESFELTGALADATGAALAGEALILQDIADLPTRKVIAEPVTDARGAFTTMFSRTENLIVRAQRTGPPAAVSDAVFVFVAPNVSLAVSSMHPLVLSGEVSPRKRHVTVQVRVARRVVEKHVVPVTRGRFSVRISRQPPFTAVALTAEDDLNAAGSSPPLRVSG